MTSADSCNARIVLRRRVPDFQASLTLWSKRWLASHLAGLPG